MHAQQMMLLYSPHEIQIYHQRYCNTINRSKKPPFSLLTKMKGQMEQEGCRMNLHRIEIMKIFANVKVYLQNMNQDLNYYQTIIREFVMPLSLRRSDWKRNFCQKCRRNYTRYAEMFAVNQQQFTKLINGRVKAEQRTTMLIGTIKTFKLLLQVFSNTSYCVPRRRRRQPLPQQQVRPVQRRNNNRRRARQQQ